MLLVIVAVAGFFAICIGLGIIAGHIEIAAERREEERKEGRKRA